jgi:hypothetical protein
MNVYLIVFNCYLKVNHEVLFFRQHCIVCYFLYIQRFIVFGYNRFIIRDRKMVCLACRMLQDVLFLFYPDAWLICGPENLNRIYECPDNVFCSKKEWKGIKKNRNEWNLIHLLSSVFTDVNLRLGVLIFNGCFLLIFRTNVQVASKKSSLQELSKLGLLQKIEYLQ